MTSVESSMPQIVAIESNSNESRIPYVYGRQQPIIPPNFTDLNLPPNPFKVLAAVAVIQPDEEYSPQTPESSSPSSISTPPLNLTTIEGWETPHTNTYENTFDSEDEPGPFYWHISSSSNEPTQVSTTSSPSSTLPPPRRQERKLN